MEKNIGCGNPRTFLYSVISSIRISEPVKPTTWVNCNFLVSWQKYLKSVFIMAKN